jgi:hypothetical protein
MRRRCPHIRQHHDKLVTAQPRHRVALAQAALHAPSHLDQQLIPGRVAMTVVHFLEAVEVEIHERELTLVTTRTVHGLLQPVGQQHPIGQIGQRIEMCHALQHLFVAPQPRNRKPERKQEDDGDRRNAPHFTPPAGQIVRLRQRHLHIERIAFHCAETADALDAVGAGRIAQRTGTLTVLDAHANRIVGRQGLVEIGFVERRKTLHEAEIITPTQQRHATLSHVDAVEQVTDRFDIDDRPDDAQKTSIGITHRPPHPDRAASRRARHPYRRKTDLPGRGLAQPPEMRQIADLDCAFDHPGRQQQPPVGIEDIQRGDLLEAGLEPLQHEADMRVIGIATRLKRTLQLQFALDIAEQTLDALEVIRQAGGDDLNQVAGGQRRSPNRLSMAACQKYRKNTEQYQQGSRKPYHRPRQTCGDRLLPPCGAHILPGSDRTHQMRCSV